MPTLTLDSFLANKNPIADDYKMFAVSDRLLLTGHSHQAWPDVAFEGHKEAYLDASCHVDEKWSFAFKKAERVIDGFAKVLGDTSGEYVLGANTHELLVRLLSALDLRARPRIVTTSGEFHSARRLFQRLQEEGIDIHTVPTEPFATLVDRLAESLTAETSALFASAVFFETARVLPLLGKLQKSASELGVLCVIDAYHALNVRDFNLGKLELQRTCILGGGYKYLQMGEGNCFLRLPPGLNLRPVVTGWFAEFSNLEKSPSGRTPYGTGGSRLAGSTYDPTSHYRAARVFDYFDSKGLTPELLQQINQRQILILREEFDRLRLVERGLDYDRSLRPDERGGFLSIRVSSSVGLSASGLSLKLREQGLWTDARGEFLRFGPAPYLTPNQLSRSMELLRNAF